MALPGSPAAPLRSKRLRARRSSGFSLMELLVVMSIIAILAAIMMPVISAAQERARRIHCMSNLHQIGVAITMYADDHGGFTPPQPKGLRDGQSSTDHRPCTLDGTDLQKQKFGIGYFVADVLMDYVSDRRIFTCPSEDRERYPPLGCPNWTYAYCSPGASISLGLPKASDYGDPSRVWLAADIQGQFWGSNHTARHAPAICYVNIGYLDGHVHYQLHPLPDGQGDTFWSDHPHPHGPPHGKR